MSVINTNMSALIATNAIIANDKNQQQAMERLSTGKRINSAGDDAAGLAISERMRAEVSGLQMATRNANDAISMLSTVEGASQEIVLMFQRMRELSVQSGSDTYSRGDRLALDLEFGQLMAEVGRIATNTTWNTMSLLNGKSAIVGGAEVAVTTSDIEATSSTIQLGKGSGETMTLTLKSWLPKNAVDLVRQNERIDAAGTVQNAEVAGGGDNDNYLGAGALFGGTVANVSNSAYAGAVLWTGGDDGAANGAGTNDERLEADVSSVGRINIETRKNAAFAITQLDKAITAASSERALIGAFISRLEHAGDNLTNVARHQEQSRSRIADADYAVESSELSRTTIIAQASTAMLAQANASGQSVLSLLK